MKWSGLAVSKFRVELKATPSPAINPEISATSLRENLQMINSYTNDTESCTL